MALSNFYLTGKGNTLLARAQTGEKITITRCQVCEGLMPEGTTYDNITALPSPVKDMVISRMEAGGNGQAKITVQFSNEGVGRPFRWMGYGLWAANPDAPEDRTEDFLYGTAFAASEDDGIPVPATLTEFRFNVILLVQQAANVTAVIDESLVYPTKDEFNDALAAKAPLSHAQDATIHVTEEEKAAWVTSAQLEEALAEIDLSGYLKTDQVGAANGAASLDESGKVPSDQLPEMNYAPASHASQHASGGSDEITPAAIGAVAVGDTVNPNLLDNWYFGNPVDQRGGYVVPPGTTYYYYDSSQTVAGTTSAYYTVKSVDTNGNATFEIDGTNYWCIGKGVRGYTGAGYGIDRWQLVNDTSTLLITNEGVKLIYDYSNWHLSQSFQDVLRKGITYTYSVLYKASGNNIRLVCSWGNNKFFYNYLSPVTDEWSLATVTGTIPEDAVIDYEQIVIQSLDSGAGTIDIKAAKLELGSQQTLAHQDADGNWVLNEIPNYNEEFLKCIQSTADTSDTYANKQILHTGNAQTLGFPKIATGSYAGTGMSGSSNPCSLTFDFKPKVLILFSGPYINIIICGISTGYKLLAPGYTMSSTYLNNFSFDGNTISWYSPENSASHQLNDSAQTYYYVALG